MGECLAPLGEPPALLGEPRALSGEPPALLGKSLALLGEPRALEGKSRAPKAEPWTKTPKPGAIRRASYRGFARPQKEFLTMLPLVIRKESSCPSRPNRLAGRHRPI